MHSQIVFSLTDFYCYSDNSPQTEENVFANVDLNKVNLHVPCNRKDAYTGADYWRDFGHLFTTDEVKQDGLWYRLDDKTWEAAIINNPDGNSRIIYGGDIVIPTDIGFSHANYDVTSIGVRAFEYSNITSVSIPKSVVSIGTSAFVGCPFTSIDIPNTVKAIGAYTFAGCSNLKSVILPNSLETIEGGLLSDCRDLESVKIPNTVTSIKHRAFSHCKSLTTIYASERFATTAIENGDGMFSNCYNLKGAIEYDSYKTSYRYANYIDGYFTYKTPAAIEYLKQDNGKTVYFDLMGRKTRKLSKGINIIRHGNKSIKVMATQNPH